MWSKDQLAHFHTFGFSLQPQLFRPDETAAITSTAESLWEEVLGRLPKDEEAIHTVPFVELRAQLTQLLEDDRIYQPLVQLMGADFIWSGSEGNRGFAPGRTAHHWHADRPGEPELGYLRVKVMIYLDRQHKDTGALRVIPGSHRLPLHQDLQPFQHSHSDSDPTFFGLTGDQIPCCALETRPGDVVFFDQSLFHAVYGKTGRRRFIALKFASRPASAAHLTSLAKWSPYVFEPHQNLVHHQSQRICRMVEGLVELKAG